MSGEIHVYRASVSDLIARLPSPAASLSDDEHERAGSYRFSQDRDRYVAARGLLRTLLGAQLKIPAAAVKFSYSEHGKPSLAPVHQSVLRFNVSHCADTVLIAVAQGIELGIDVESIKPAVASKDIPERFFTARETERIRARPTELQPDLFFDCWVRKEAAIKAWGVGLSLPLDSFDVAPGAESPMRIECPIRRGTAWFLCMLDAPPGYKAALVAEGTPVPVRSLA